MFDEAEKVAKELEIELILPPKFGNKNGFSNDTILCDDPWKFFYVEVQGSVNPCCFAGEHIGYLDKQDFFDIWNSEGYTMLREGLVNNKPHMWCKNCYRYNPENVDNILSHITFRPETQKKIIEYLKKHKDEFKLSKETFEL
jgi:MoaA/NifB/PqqE/SkfB family radical SAM enzyme